MKFEVCITEDGMLGMRLLQEGPGYTRICSVDRGSIAEEAGLKENDTVSKEFNDLLKLCGIKPRSKFPLQFTVVRIIPNEKDVIQWPARTGKYIKTRYPLEGQTKYDDLIVHGLDTIALEGGMSLVSGNELPTEWQSFVITKRRSYVRDEIMEVFPGRWLLAEKSEQESTGQYSFSRLRLPKAKDKVLNALSRTITPLSRKRVLHEERVEQEEKRRKTAQEWVRKNDEAKAEKALDRAEAEKALDRAVLAPIERSSALDRALKVEEKLLVEEDKLTKAAEQGKITIAQRDAAVKALQALVDAERDYRKTRAKITAEWDSELRKIQPESERNDRLTVLVGRRVEALESYQKQVAVLRHEYIMNSGGANTFFKAADVSLVSGAQFLEDTGFYSAQSPDTIRRKEKTFSRKRNRLEGKLQMPNFEYDEEAFQRNPVIVMTATILSELAGEESKTLTYNVHQLLRVCDDLPDELFLPLAQAISDMLTLVCITTGRPGDRLEKLIQGARARFKAAGKQSHRKQLDDPSFCQFLAACMWARGVPITLLQECSKGHGISLLLKATLTGLLVEDALPSLEIVVLDPCESEMEDVDVESITTTAGRAKCQYGEFANALQLLGVSKNDYRAMEEYKFQSVVQTKQDRINVNLWMAARKPGQKVEPSEIKVDYKVGEPKVLELDAFMWVPVQNGGLKMVSDSGKEDELEKLIDAFYDEFVHKEGDVRPVSPFRSWWREMTNNVSLFWGYSWEWFFQDGTVLRKG